MELVLAPEMPPELELPVADVALWLWDVSSLPVLTYPPAPPVPAPPVAAPPLAVAGPDVATPVWTTVALLDRRLDVRLQSILVEPDVCQRVRRKHEPNCEHSECEQSA